MPFLARTSLFLTLAALLITGCGEAEPPPPPEKTVEVPAGPKVYTLEELPEVGEYLPPLELGVLHVPQPKGWTPLADNLSFVCAFAKEDATSLPHIVINSDSGKGKKKFDSVTADNLEEFTATIKPEGEILEKPKPLILGDNAYARYVKGALYKNKKIEVQVLVTQYKERIYTVELRVPSGQLKKDRDVAYAVAAHLKFGENAPVPPSAETTVPSDAPATPEPAKPAEEPAK